ncbi:MAG: hypothetical protein PHV05_05995 [Candidatus Riflebacteria bacterium]|nr:hypothetical protein [Candidatus Riflebacteria bacterium]
MLMKKLCLTLVIALMPFMLHASGLTLYSYRDDLGQLIVVDSIERIPEKYREGIHQSFIPSFKNAEPAVSVEDEYFATDLTTTATLTLPPESSIAIPSPAASEPIKLEEILPEIEPPNPAIASAEIILAKIKEIQFNNERLYVMAQVLTAKHPVVKHLHLTNLLNLQNIMPPEALKWEAAAAWKSKARYIIEELKTIQFSISKWLPEGSDAITIALRPLVARVRNLIVALEKEFPKEDQSEKPSR